MLQAAVPMSKEQTEGRITVFLYSWRYPAYLAMLRPFNRHIINAKRILANTTLKIPIWNIIRNTSTNII